MNTAIQRVIEELRSYLPQYLESLGLDVDNGKFIKCINKEHNDNTPSMSLDPTTNKQTLHCFGCSANYNIFQAAQQLEDKDDHGPRFITDTIPYLADKFQIPYAKEDLVLDPETLEKYRYRQIYEDAVSVIRKIGTYNHTRARGWEDEVCKKEGIGSVDWDIFLKELCNRGNYTESELKLRDIKVSMFNANTITFPIRDHFGRVCGFGSRNTLFNKADKSTHPKFKNSSDSVPIYSKGEILYGIHIAVKYTERRLDIYEGYSDWVTAQNFNYPNCVSLCGTALTQNHVDLLKKLGFNHINLVLDGDETGKKQNKQLFERYYNTDGLKITMMDLPFSEDQPQDKRDPDDYFREYGKNAYLLLKPLSVFDIKLKEATANLKISNGNSAALASKMIPYIIMETSPIERGRMIRELHDVSKVQEEDIRAEIKSKADSNIKDIAVNLQNKLAKAKDSLEIKDIVSAANTRIQSNSGKKELSNYHLSESVSHLDKWFEERLNPSTDIDGWKTGYKTLDDPLILGGIPKKESIITIAGSPNHGKSGITTNIEKQLILPENNNKGLSVLKWILDDSRNVEWSKLMASCMKVSILDIQRPTERIFHDPALKKSYNEWFAFLRESAKTGKIVVKGHEIGNDLESAEYWIKYVQDTTGNKVVLIIDAVHDMKTGNSTYDNDERIKFVRCYDWFQRTTETMNYTVIACSHITKGGMAKGKPEQNDLSEAGKIIFSSKLIGIVYSELDHVRSKGISGVGATDMYWIDEDDGDSYDKRKPIVEFSITKNKITSYKGQLFFKHKSDACWMEPLTTQQVMAIKRKNAQERGGIIEIGLPRATERDEEDLTAEI